MSPAQAVVLREIEEEGGLIPARRGLGATLAALAEQGLVAFSKPLPRRRGGHYDEGCYRVWLLDWGIRLIPAVQPASRGGARPGSGRKPRSPDGASTVRPGVPMTDAEWSGIVAYAVAHEVTNAEACRRLIALGLKR